MKECPECGSRKILRGAKTDETGYGHFVIKAFKRPDAKLFKKSVTSKVRAEICTGCGYIQFFAVKLNKLKSVYEFQGDRYNLDRREGGWDI